MESKETDKSEDVGESADRLLAEYMLQVANLSYQTQLDNYQSLTGHAGRLVSGIALLSIATVTTVIPASAMFEDAGLKGVFVATCFCVFATMIASFILAIVAQFRFAFNALNSPRGLKYELIAIQNGELPFKTKLEIAQHFCDSIEAGYSSVQKRNRIMSRTLQAANIVLIVSAGLVALFACITAILYLL